MKSTVSNLSLTACAFGVMSKTLVSNQVHEVLGISFKSFIVLDLAFRLYVFRHMKFLSQKPKYSCLLVSDS